MSAVLYSVIKVVKLTTWLSEISWHASIVLAVLTHFNISTIEHTFVGSEVALISHFMENKILKLIPDKIVAEPVISSLLHFILHLMNIYINTEEMEQEPEWAARTPR